MGSHTDPVADLVCGMKDYVLAFSEALQNLDFGFIPVADFDISHSGAAIFDDEGTPAPTSAKHGAHGSLQNVFA